MSDRPSPDDSASINGAGLPPGRRIYAIGDIHGHAALLDRMAERIAADLGLSPCAEPLTVFLGDYIDRGPDSAGVIDRLVKGNFPTPIVTLRGNHEQLMLDALVNPDQLPHWMANGGTATMRSYGALDDRVDRGAWEMRDAFLAALPSPHLEFIKHLPFSFTDGGYFFCHAGVKPGVAFAHQNAHDLMWIRGAFLDAESDFGKVVVHGHTPMNAPESLHNRINVDTGAFATGTLTCVSLENERRRFLSVNAR